MKSLLSSLILESLEGVIADNFSQNFLKDTIHVFSEICRKACKEHPSQFVSGFVGINFYNILICRRLFFFLEDAFYL